MKKTTRKKSWGGRRKGAGRPPGTGTGQGKDARVNRVVVMLSDAELKKLKTRAKRLNLPLGTCAYWIIVRSLTRA